MYSIKGFCLPEFILFSIQIRLKIIIMHHHGFFEQMPCQPYDLKFGMAEASMFLCDDVFLAVIGWSRGSDNDNDADDDTKIGITCLVLTTNCTLFETPKIHKFV